MHTNIHPQDEWIQFMLNITMNWVIDISLKTVIANASCLIYFQLVCLCSFSYVSSKGNNRTLWQKHHTAFVKFIFDCRVLSHCYIGEVCDVGWAPATDAGDDR